MEITVLWLFIFFFWLFYVIYVCTKNIAKKKTYFLLNFINLLDMFYASCSLLLSYRKFESEKKSYALIM